MIRRPLALLLLSLPLAACDGGSPEDPALRRAERPTVDSGREDGGMFEGQTTACASFLQSLLDGLLQGPAAPPWWANSDVTPGGLIALGGGSVGIGNGGVTTVADLPGLCAAIEAELGLPVGYLQPGTESIPGGYVEGCACTDCGMEPDAEGLDTFDSVGLGNSASPHEIYNSEQLADLAESEPAWNQHYVQCSDIDLEPYYASGGEEFNIATEDQPFRGVYDGQEHRILSFTSHADGGLFEYAWSATIESLTLYGANIDLPVGFDNDSDTGALLDFGRDTILRDVHVVASSVFVEGGLFAGAGGLAGKLYDSEVRDSTVEDSVVSCVEPTDGSFGTCWMAGMLQSVLRTVVEDCDVIETEVLTWTAEGGQNAGMVGAALGSEFRNVAILGGRTRARFLGGFVIQLTRSLASNVTVETTLEGREGGGIGNSVGNSTIEDSVAIVTLDAPETEFSFGRFGGLAGHMSSGDDSVSAIRRSVADMDIEGVAPGYEWVESPVGGVLGHVHGNAVIEDTLALGDISVAFAPQGQVLAGGFIGRVMTDANLVVDSSYSVGSVEGTTTGAFIGQVQDGASVTVTESFGIGHHTGTGGCFVGEGTINDDGNNYVADIPCACEVEPGVSTAPLADFDQPNDNLGFDWSTDVWTFEDGALPSLQ